MAIQQANQESFGRAGCYYRAVEYPKMRLICKQHRVDLALKLLQLRCGEGDF
jgi:hypothetical protein